MRTIGVRLATVLSTAQLGGIFQQSTSELRHGVTGKVVAATRWAASKGVVQFEYFTPHDTSPFAALDDDRPNFAVGVNVPKFVGTGGGFATLHMYVWERRGKRGTCQPF
jgi:hypothetical protein